MYTFFLKDKRQTSELIDLGKFAETHESLLQTCPYIENNDSRKSDILQLMNTDIDDEYLEKLMKHCHDTQNESDENAHNTGLNIWPLWNPLKRNNKWKYLPEKVSPEAMKFKTMKKLHERIQIDMKYQYKNYIKCINDIIPLDQFTTPETSPDLIPGREILIRIRIYQPNATSHVKTIPKFSHDLVVLGSHTLDVLRDKIICPNDLASFCDTSDDAKIENVTFTKDIFKSGFLYIEDTFYNDTRDPLNIDYSESIINWASGRSGFPVFKKAIMENTTFNNLKVHLGYPQVYRHQGNCEHVFVFSDVEILQPSDICHSVKYPYYKSLSGTKGRHCNMCGLFLAKWYVRNSDRIPFDPAYFCDSCFRSYNYRDGKKIGDFKAYPYFDRGLAL